jgi:cytochrome c553
VGYGAISVVRVSRRVREVLVRIEQSWPKMNAVYAATMNLLVTLIGAVPISILGSGTVLAQVESPPAWAFPVNSREQPTRDSDANAPRHVPNSSAVFTNAQVNNLFLAPDWHPDEHPLAPAVVARGRVPGVNACGYCHRITGSGGPENAKIAGLPYDYIVRQLSDYQTGTRSTSLPARVPQALMIASAKALTREEMAEAARYFSKLRPTENIRVVEVAVVPKTHAEGWRLEADPGNETEVIGPRIVELPDRPDYFESRDPHATFTAYVPIGSVALGRKLSHDTHNASTARCVACHGADLRGSNLAPPLAGRSPTYLVRQLFDIQHGVRAGPRLDAMKTSISGLKIDDMIAIAAYAASLRPENR